MSRPDPQVFEHAFSYEGLTPWTAGPEAFLAQLNAQGNKGMRYFGQAAGRDSDPQLVYVKDRETTYTYELHEAPDTLGAFRTQLTDRGAAGFQWIGTYHQQQNPDTRLAWQLYRRDSTANTTFSYRAEKYAAFTTEAIVVEANTHGAEGYFLSNVFTTAGNFLGGVYEKDQKSKSIYSYGVAELQDAKNATFLDTANDWGARGFRLIDMGHNGINGPRFV